MKTCKDCIYWVDIKHPDPLHIGEGECRLYPEPRTQVFPNHWCGQLKEKVHVISDFTEHSENHILKVES